MAFAARRLHKFAHMADVHIGAYREPALLRLEAEAFGAAMRECVSSGVDFVLICGDLFHVGIPDLGVVNSAVRSMVGVREAGIPIYAIYGSHDYTPNGTSVIDILDTSGVLTNVSKWHMADGKLRLEVLSDEKTGAKIAGISARKIGLESKYYEALDREALEAEKGFRVFAFHSGVTQFKPPHLKEMETVDISLFPRGLEYYAGGHIHQRGEYSLDGYQTVVFPGPLFTGYGKDLEDTAKGEKRGFYMVEFDDRVRSKRFVPVKGFDGLYREFDFAGKSALQANQELQSGFDRSEVGGKVVVVRAAGELAGGSPSEVEFAKLRSRLAERGAIHVYLNRRALSARDGSAAVTGGEDVSAIEDRVFKEEIARFNLSERRLTGERGTAVGRELLRLMRQPPKSNESKKDYVQRMVRDGVKTLGLEEAPRE